MSYKLLIAGSRDFDDREMLYSKLDSITSVRAPGLVITGGARGADALGYQWGQARRFGTHVEPAAWELYGKSAGFIRNQRMVEMLGSGDLVVIFYGPNGLTRGSSHTRDLALSAGIETRCFVQARAVPE